ncbi:MAG: hypothetical protein GY751_25785 [Bacteroidetes bacterium]|nr:hypothetical protein [Bacteroidota bacterium]
MKPIKEIKISSAPNKKGAPDKFYAKCGFIDTQEKRGKRDHHETHLKRIRKAQLLYIYPK